MDRDATSQLDSVERACAAAEMQSCFPQPRLFYNDAEYSMGRAACLNETSCLVKVLKEPKAIAVKAGSCFNGQSLPFSTSFTAGCSAASSLRR